MVQELEYSLLNERALHNGAFNNKALEKEAAVLQKAEEKTKKTRKEMKEFMESLNVVLEAFEKVDGTGLSGDALKYYCEWMDKNGGTPDFSDERMSKLIHDISECELMSNYDKQVFKEAVDDICKTAPIDLYIAGHIHAYAEHKCQEDNGANKAEDSTDSDTPEKVRHILVADCFHAEGHDGVRGYLIKNVFANPEWEAVEAHRLNVNRQ